MKKQMKSQDKPYLYRIAGFKKKEDFNSYRENIQNSRKEKNKFLKNRERIIKESLYPEVSSLIKKQEAYVKESMIHMENLIDRRYRTAEDARHNGYSSYNISKGKNYSFHVDSYNDWNIYSRSTKYPAHVYYNKISFPLWHEAPNKDLEIIDGLVNIQINFSKKIDDIIIYNAVWIEQRMGNNVEAVSGFIANKNEIYYHSKISEDDAVECLEKKIKKLQKPEKAKVAFSEIKSSDYITRKKFHTLTGACYAGIENFCAKAGISSEIKKVKIADVMPLLKVHAEYWYNLVIKNAPQLKIID